MTLVDDRQRLSEELRGLGRAIVDAFRPAFEALAKLNGPKVTQAERWAEHIVDIWEEEVDNRMLAVQSGKGGPNAQLYLSRAERCLAAAQYQLDLGRSGAWPDDDRAARTDGKTKTTPG